MWAWCFLFGKIINYCFNFFNAHGIYSDVSSFISDINILWLLSYSLRLVKGILIIVVWMFVSPILIHTLNSNSQSDGIRRWGPWEVVRSGGQEPSSLGLVPYKRHQRASSFISLWQDTVRSQQCANWKRAFTRTWPCWHPQLGLSASGLWKINFCL